MHPVATADSGGNSLMDPRRLGLALSDATMRILVFSYEFLPSDAPQALRVSRLTRELVACGHRVDVIAAMGPASAVAEELIDGVSVHRVNPGGVDGLVAWMKGSSPHRAVSTGAPALASGRRGLNWKGKCIQFGRTVLDALVFPDARSLWVRSALRRARVLVDEHGKPDLLIGSHEPAAGVMAAMRFSGETDVEFVSELGDPILATYTPSRWRQRAFDLENEVFERSAAVVLTSEATARLFEQRHGVESKLHVISQGFDPQPEGGSRKDEVGEDVLRLVYTGRFYSFRNPMPLLQAVAATPGCELVFAAPEVPKSVEEFLQTEGANCVWVGSLPHAEALALQSSSDLVVSIGNAGMTQLPGKVLEYMGSGRPILHIRPDLEDAAARLVEVENCGYVVDANVDEISNLLVDLLARKRNGTLGQDLVIGAAALEKYSWQSLGFRFSSICEAVRGMSADGPERSSQTEHP